MFNVKFLKVKVRYYGLIKEIYINLNYVESISPDFEDYTCDRITLVRTVSGKEFCVLMDFDDFVNYLIDLSESQKGGEFD